MKLRLAIEDDIDFLLYASRKLHEKSPYSSLEFSEDKTGKLILEFLKAPKETKVIIIAETTRPVGVIACQATQLYFSDRWVIIEPLFWTDHPKAYIPLVKAAEEWAVVIGADKLTIGSLSKNKVLEKMGYKVIEYSYGLPERAVPRREE